MKPTCDNCAHMSFLNTNRMVHRYCQRMDIYIPEGLNAPCDFYKKDDFVHDPYEED